MLAGALLTPPDKLLICRGHSTLVPSRHTPPHWATDRKKKGQHIIRNCAHVHVYPPVMYTCTCTIYMYAWDRNYYERITSYK